MNLRNVLDTHISKAAVPILMYHSVASTATARFKDYAISTENFAEQMAYLSARRYTTLTVSQYIATRAANGRSLPVRPIVITFDDGYADFYSSALPILRHFNLTATIYVATAFIGRSTLWLKDIGEADRQVLSRSQIRDVYQAGFEVGGHGHTHVHLDTLPTTKARAEIKSCKEALENITGKEVSSFAYPFGCYTTSTRDLVRETGFSSACTSDHWANFAWENPFTLGRAFVPASTQLPGFSALLEIRSSTLRRVFKQFYSRAWRWGRQGRDWAADFRAARQQQ